MKKDDLHRSVRGSTKEFMGVCPTVNKRILGGDRFLRISRRQSTDEVECCAL